MASFVSRMIENRKERRRKKKDLKVARAMLLGMEPKECDGFELAYNYLSLAPPSRKNCALMAIVRGLPDGNIVYGKDIYHLASRYLQFEKRIMENNK